MSDLDAGRELDVLVAEKVMGWTNLRTTKAGMRRGTPAEYPHIGHEVPPYSTDMSAAWEVVEKMREREGYAGVESNHDLWEASMGPWYVATAETAPLAICRAALAAIASTPIPEPPSVDPVLEGTP
jgi:hypothetical protein